MAPRKGKCDNVKKASDILDIAQQPLVSRGSVKVLARPCPIMDVVSLGKRKARTDDAVELCKEGKEHIIRLNIQDCRQKSKASNKNVFKLPWVGPQTTQTEMYEGMKSVVKTFLELQSCDCALLAYGATGSGKTFSMQGPRRAYIQAVDGVAPNTVDDHEGLLQRCLKHIFERPSDNRTVSVCAVEIYKEKIRDLLVPGARWDDPASECEILSNQGGADTSKCNNADVKLMGQVQLRHKDKSKLREVKVEGVHDCMHTLSDALQSRTCRETKKNPESSRSHMLIGISLCAPPLQAQLDGRETQQVSKTATLWLGDLCGAEAYDPAASAQQKRETLAINQSLLAFMRCLQTLWCNQQLNENGFPQVRASALTRVLADIMQGVGHLAMSVHFSLRDSDIESTRRTLRFAEQVAQLRFEAGMRVQQTVELDGEGAAEAPEDAPDAAGVVTDERRAATERQTQDRQRLLEFPELLRQRNWLQREVAELRKAALEREEAAYDSGFNDGKEEAEKANGSGEREADAELLELANQDWEQRLEQAVHQAKENMHAQMCLRVEEVTARSYQRETKLNGEIAALRKRLRRAGLLQDRLPLQRRTLVRVSRQSGGSGSDTDDGTAGPSPARPSVIEEDDEHGASEEGDVATQAEADNGPTAVEADAGAEESGDEPSECGSSGREPAERGAVQAVAAAAPLEPEEEDGDVPSGAVQSQRGGGMAISISEVAGVRREVGQDCAADERTVDALARREEASEALEAERLKRVAAEAAVSLLREQVQTLLQESEERLMERDAVVMYATALKEKGGTGRVSGGTLRDEVDATAQWKKASEALQAERQRHMATQADASLHREQVQALREEMGALRKENAALQSECGVREALSMEVEALEKKVQALRQENAVLKQAHGACGGEPEAANRKVAGGAESSPVQQPCAPPGRGGSVSDGQPVEAQGCAGGVKEQAQQDNQTCKEKDVAPENGAGASPQSEMSEERYKAVLREAQAEATDSDDAHDEPADADGTPTAHLPQCPTPDATAAVPRTPRDSEDGAVGGMHADAAQAGVGETATAAVAPPAAPTPASGRGGTPDYQELADLMGDPVNLSIAPSPEQAEEAPSEPGPLPLTETEAPFEQPGPLPLTEAEALSEQPGPLPLTGTEAPSEQPGLMPLTETEAPSEQPSPLPLTETEAPSEQPGPLPLTEIEALSGQPGPLPLQLPHIEGAGATSGELAEDTCKTDVGTADGVRPPEPGAGAHSTTVEEGADVRGHGGGPRRARGGRQPAAAKLPAPAVHRNTLQSLLKAVPLPKVESGLVDVLPDAGGRFEEEEEEPARPRRAAARGKAPKARGRADPLEELLRGTAEKENAALQAGRKGRVTRLAKGHLAATGAAALGETAPPARALRRRN